MRKKVNQMTKIKEHLREKGTITSMEAFRKYGCTRLSDKIFCLRNKGWKIKTIMTETVTRYGDKCDFAIYKLIKEGK